MALAKLDSGEASVVEVKKAETAPPATGGKGGGGGGSKGANTAPTQADNKKPDTNRTTVNKPTPAGAIPPDVKARVEDQISVLIGQQKTVPQIIQRIKAQHPSWTEAQITALIQQAHKPPPTESATGEVKGKAADPRPKETLSRAITRMYSEGYSQTEIDKELKKWHPKWSSSRVHRLVRDGKPTRLAGTGVVPGQRTADSRKVLVQRRAKDLPHLEKAHGAGQGKPKYQSKPYYPNQRPFAVTPNGPLFKNPQSSVPSWTTLANKPWEAKYKKYIHEEHSRNADRLFADLRWVATHPGRVSEVAAFAALLPEDILPGLAYAAVAADVFGLASTGVDVSKGHYSAAGVDLLAVGIALRGEAAAARAKELNEQIRAERAQVNRLIEQETATEDPRSAEAIREKILATNANERREKTLVLRAKKAESAAAVAAAALSELASRLAESDEDVPKSRDKNFLAR